MNIRELAGFSRFERGLIDPRSPKLRTGAFRIVDSRLLPFRPGLEIETRSGTPNVAVTLTCIKMFPRTESGYTLYQQFLRANRAFHTRGFSYDYNPAGVDVFDEDWDTLVLLDACRYDSLSKYDLVPGRLETRESRGSATIEFLKGNFAGRTLHDTVYVTGTPQVHRFSESLNVEFHDVWNVWRDSDKLWKAPDGRKAVKPETLTQVAKKAAARFPNKRRIVHYTQPHVPYLDPPVESLRTPGNPYRMWLKGQVEASATDLRTAYDTNLERAVSAVKDLIANINGKIVITSDHGELLGERIAPLPVRAWGHPHGIYVPELIKVPWLIHENGNRPNIKAENPVRKSEQIDTRTVEERLQNLGYRT